ncbi:IclR family transcriptional regulator domain-containing protein [Novosphingobium guangzhouense]|nr:IclR family transcriptional regulator C-terminal domain-containing protein [Novosphingobium guangzhouense]
MMESGVPIRSVSRTLGVLRTINEFGSVSMSEIARHENLPYPTAFRIMQTLLHEGMIEREDRSKRYRPTALVQSLASGYEGQKLRTAAQPLMSDLTREIGWPVFLSERVGRRFVIRASTHHETTLTFFNWKPGCTFPVLGSVTGMAWLAYQSENCAHDLLRGEMDPDTRNDMFDVEELLRSLEQVRTNGYAWRPSVYERNGKTASLAIPIVRDGSVENVLTMTYFASAMKETVAVDRYLDRLRSSAETIATTPLH